MEILWRFGAAMTVSDVHMALTAERELAYTTVMTVLDRLAKKGMLQRSRSGRAWEYLPTQSQQSFYVKSMVELVEQVPDEIREELVAEFLSELATVNSRKSLDS